MSRVRRCAPSKNDTQRTQNSDLDDSFSTQYSGVSLDHLRTIDLIFFRSSTSNAFFRVFKRVCGRDAGIVAKMSHDPVNLGISDTDRQKDNLILGRPDDEILILNPPDAVLLLLSPLKTCFCVPCDISAFRLVSNPIFMRLLNTKTLRLEEFYSEIPPYAILSHTWEKEEVTFQDIQNLEIARRKAGYVKVWKACVRAQRYDFDWIWIDSCCINKDSSAELSEAINSMYQYYEDAEVCYAYLCDVSASYHPRDPCSGFRSSRWFRRGWTLQELLAPSHVVFLDRDWIRIGTRWSLRDVISATTAIPVKVFEGHDINAFSVAQRISWAALRETTRPEDQAYCLMGIFGVSMPPIYGEGGIKAFMRLQQEIIKISDDRSIFAWTASSKGEGPRGLLARSPYEFRMSGEVKASEPDVGDRASYSFGNNGLHIHLPLVTTDSSHFGADVFLAYLHCQSGRDGSYIHVYLRKTARQRYVRCHADELALLPSLSPAENIQELTVKENPIPRHCCCPQREHMSVNTSAHSICLLPSARHFSLQHSQKWLQKDTVHHIDEQTASISLQQSADCDETVILEYHSWTTAERFSINLHSTYPLGLDYVELKTVVPSFASFGPDKEDAIYGPLQSGAHVSLTCEMRGHGSQKVFEIDYIPKEHPSTFFMAQTLHPPESGFMVPLELAGCTPIGGDIKLVDIYPPDFFGKRFRDQAYITLPDDDDDDDDTSNRFRVLTYQLWEGKRTFYVALGFQNSTAWTDILRRYKSETAEEVWKSYLAQGSRAPKRLECQTSTSALIYYDASFSLPHDLTASVKKRTSLQIGTHLLLLEEVLNLYPPSEVENLD
ncbi:hypothetical protein D9758_013179 [Tetrapyrgos nigripes]|uniref:Heterokaryon incompatibility domain-containing protein n=1 Tax=Tetrapyrgos nigripes TaxID=182062 RepID=A0A8H5FKH3_9AGAR|nr:hypothetical protein D9758_013179 [Tetrapyrgos nigripes]